ncbi:MAG: type II toxin-antitoxin system RelB/DinJ family antitoxin [Candidatus Thioglobus sp.]|nr:type II toxin-antitoxin system RelB/DinJ family antitoxin [Candidatus Thioglobus sp.]
MLAQIEKSRTNVYLNKVKKEQAKAIFKQYGMGLSDAINIFLTQAVAMRGIPFEVKLPKKHTPNTPNAETIQAIKEANDPENSQIMTLEEFMADMQKQVSPEFKNSKYLSMNLDELKREYKKCAFD